MSVGNEKRRLTAHYGGHMKISGAHRKCTVLVFSVFFYTFVSANVMFICWGGGMDPPQTPLHL